MTQACCEPVLQSSAAQGETHFALTSAAVQFSWLTAHLYEKQITRRVGSLTQACCEPFVQSSTQVMNRGMHFAPASAAVQVFWLTAHLLKEQISICVTAVTQACYKPVLQSTTQQWRTHFAQNSAAVQFGGALHTV